MSYRIMLKENEKTIRGILTYHNDDGTSGWCASEEQFNNLFSFVNNLELEAKKEAKQEFEQKLNQAIIELREKIIKN